MRIGECASRRGAIVRGSLTLAKHHAEEIEIPVVIAEGKEKGPIAFVSAGIHGDEINGVAVLDRFLKQLDPRKLSGTLIMVPVLNITGFRAKVREVTYDNKDLNRVFNLKGRSVSHRMADTFLEEVCSQCDFGIDLHDAGDQDVLLPHSRVHTKESDGCTHELGAQFGTEIVLERRGWKGMMAVECHRTYKIPVLTVEIGGGMVIWDKFIPVGVRGIRNILITHNMLKGKILLPEHQFFLSRREGYIAPIEGILGLNKGLGDEVVSGELLGEIVNPVTGESDKINAYECGVVFSVRQQAKIDKGQTAISVIHFKQDKRHGRKPSDPEHARMVINSADTLGINHQLIRGDIFSKARTLKPKQ